VEAEELFEASSPLARQVSERGGDPIEAARAILDTLTEAEKVATLNAHPRIGERQNLSERSRREQGSEEDPAVMAELERLNAEYERKFGFRFVVFVNRRPRSAILDVLRERLDRDRAVELKEGLDAIIAIAENRWNRQLKSP
jgi:2-oxo-4-hydroxy-4-carboxy--5-ureidoimidazoline (OHCU) decarboxylase